MFNENKFLFFLHCLLFGAWMCVHAPWHRHICGSRIGICVRKQMFSQGVSGVLSSVWKRMHTVLTVIGACVKPNPCPGPLCSLLSCIPTFFPVDWNPGRCTADYETCLRWQKGIQQDRLHSHTGFPNQLTIYPCWVCWCLTPESLS